MTEKEYGLDEINNQHVESSTKIERLEKRFKTYIEDNPLDINEDLGVPADRIDIMAGKDNIIFRSTSYRRKIEISTDGGATWDFLSQSSFGYGSSEKIKLTPYVNDRYVFIYVNKYKSNGTLHRANLNTPTTFSKLRTLQTTLSDALFQQISSKYFAIIGQTMVQVCDVYGAIIKDIPLGDKEIRNNGYALYKGSSYGVLEKDYFKALYKQAWGTTTWTPVSGIPSDHSFITIIGGEDNLTILTSVRDDDNESWVHVWNGNEDGTIAHTRAYKSYEVVVATNRFFGYGKFIVQCVGSSRLAVSFDGGASFTRTASVVPAPGEPYANYGAVCYSNNRMFIFTQGADRPYRTKPIPRTSRIVPKTLVKGLYLADEVTGDLFTITVVNGVMKCTPAGPASAGTVPVVQ